MVQMLQEHPFLATLEERYLDTLARVAYPETFYEGDYLFRAGESAESCFLIRTGLVAIELYDPQKGAVKVETLGDGRVVGWSWIVAPYVWCFDGQALQLTRVISFDAEKLRRACEDDHEFGYIILKRFTGVFSDRLHAARLQLLDMFAPPG
jgi:CRP-like cAMP-binding protein